MKKSMAYTFLFALAALLSVLTGMAQGKPTSQEPRQTPGSSPAAPVMVSSVEVKFHTNDDDKDENTKLVTDFMCRDSIFASSNLGWAEAGAAIMLPKQFGLPWRRSYGCVQRQSRHKLDADQGKQCGRQERSPQLLH